MENDGPQIEQLLVATGLGDRAAFLSLYDRTSAKLFGICLRILKDEATSEQVLQDIYRQIWQDAVRHRANGLSPTAWLTMLARKNAIDHLRHHGRATVAGFDDDDGFFDLLSGQGGAGDYTASGSRIDRCLDRLEPENAEALRRAYLDGESYAELAQEFSLPLNRMREEVQNSLLTLRDYLDQ